ncbi:MAG: T9SS type A sorting domain-containing protein [Saprospiraceae bacterium]|nr:T9SS type A sorting domain-containing protein [Saprospiraceae bacterium]MCF8252228.1 T9SS type A sorting domain-containing protein [Saprospiraceae bacterium]MCF8283272.1 T9SS type A sorting domain-containing protein [Bacteroidales bacterium]MCF8313892.1 T9SS type A sorting domain-containing protein [Saprospiraceae bacterium]MCF8443271.1 T9SS type A sorting domain-containing protein [Saprospiraceae bacterium]
MKQTLLVVFLAFSSFALYGQSNSEPTGTLPVKISIYPNPATNYISVNKDENLKEISIYNLVGRKLKTFEEIEKDEHYDVSDLPNGMYLVQVIDNNKKIVTTQRISKR